MQSLPLGIQDFAKIREANQLYVDKTTYIESILKEGTYIFYVCPRRFGKSLLCSTLRYLYEGRQDLFEGLYIHDKVNWETIQHPVIHIDMQAVSTEIIDFGESLNVYTENILIDHNIQIPQKDAHTQLKALISHYAKQGKTVVVIIDEYDRPLNDVLDDPEKFNHHRKILRDFYGILKPFDGVLHKVFFTGVSKYGKTSVFSTLNNLTDISLNKPYTTMCGYTPEELEQYFMPHLEDTALHFGRQVNDLIAEMRLRYNGYSFDAVHTVYNPYAVLSFFNAQEFKNFWFDTGTPYFLLKLMRQYKINYDTLEHIETEVSLLGLAEIEHQNLIALLFQTGYLTLKKAIRYGFDLVYQLGFPNIEVKQAFSRYVLVEYFNKGMDLVSTDIAAPIRSAFYKRDIPALIQVMQERVYPQIPYQIYDTKEAYYHTIFHVTLNTAGFRTYSEVQTNLGRIDMVVETYDTIFIFEFKLDETAEIALDQIHARQYYQPFLAYGYPVYAIGINFSSQERNIVEYKMVEVV